MAVEGHLAQSMELRRIFEQGLAAHRAGQLGRAEDLYRTILRSDASNFPALHMLGFLKAQQGRYEDAIVLLKKAVRYNPSDPTALGHYAHALMAAQRFADALINYDRLISIQSANFEAHYNRGVILSQQQRHEEALLSLDKALALQPTATMAHFNRGVVLTELERYREALDCYDRVLAQDPGYAPALANRAMVALHLCDWERVAQLSPEQAVMLAPPLTFLSYSSDKRLQLECASATTRTLVPKLVKPMWTGEKYRHDRIRLGYVSADFREHAVAFQIASLIESHDRERFQVIGISTGFADDSDIRARLKKGFDRFYDFSGLNSDEIARRMRDMEIDIAVDLGGHTGLNRLQIFSHRPAPVQVSWLGYPGTTGAPFIDYIIADNIVAPAEDQPFYSEKLVHLPQTYFPTDRLRPIATPPQRADEGLPSEGFIFCCFNNAWKITKPIFDCWMRILLQIPGSVLWLKQPSPDTRANLERAAACRGVSPSRLIFAANTSLDMHLARHQLADLFLDTIPYNAHATAADALGAGLPVMTYRGEAFAGRVAASLLNAVGLPELVTESLQAYEDLALKLARDPERLGRVRQALVQNLTTAPLFDGEQFRRAIEVAFCNMLDAVG